MWISRPNLNNCATGRLQAHLSTQVSFFRKNSETVCVAGTRHTTYNIQHPSMISWRSRQQFKYFLFLIILALVGAGIGAYFFLNRPGSCFDGVQNNGELGVDCGGSCARLCPFEVSEVITHWVRVFPARVSGGESVYDAAAFLENPNFDAEVKNVSYTFTLYDAKNVLSGTRKGSTFLAPGDRFVLYENGIPAGSGTHAPQRALLEIENLRWERVLKSTESDMPARDELVTDGARFESAPAGSAPKVFATITNRSLRDVRDIEVVAVLSGVDDNVIDASKTTISRLGAGESKTVTLLLSLTLREIPARIEVFPHWSVAR